jgi:hypothetical protein
VWWCDSYGALLGDAPGAEASSLEAWQGRIHPEDRQKVRVCHLFEDFPDVKRAFAYPGLPLAGDEPSQYANTHPNRPVWARPYCSASGGMAINVVDR